MAGPIAHANNLVPIVGAPTCFFAVEMGIISTLAKTNHAGGSLVNGTTYYWVVTSADRASGETTRSNEISMTPGSGYNSVDLAWTAVTGASTYRIYRTTTAGSYGASSLVGTATTNSYYDVGNATTAGTPPGENTALSLKIDPAGTYGWLNSNLAFDFAGTIMDGQWEAYRIGPTYGGTGQTSVTEGDVLYGSPGGNAWSKLAIGGSGSALVSVGGVPTWSWVGATHGGTGQTAVASGDLLYGSGTDAWGRLTKATDGEVLTLVSGLPAWAASSGGITNASSELRNIGSTDFVVPISYSRVNLGTAYLEITLPSISGWHLVTCILSVNTQSATTFSAKFKQGNVYPFIPYVDVASSEKSRHVANPGTARESLVIQSILAGADGMSIQVWAEEPTFGNKLSILRATTTLSYIRIS